MSEEFKRKLAAYEKGELCGEELEAFEKELEKLEQYQAYLNQSGSEQQESDHFRQIKEKGSARFDENRLKRMFRRGKWKARFQTAFVVFGLLLIFLFLTSILSTAYFSIGDRPQLYSTVIDHTLTVTDPYGQYGGYTMNVKPFFQVEIARDMVKRVGGGIIETGKLHFRFLFSKMENPERLTYGKTSDDRPSFLYPGSLEQGVVEWGRLEKLPAGTVASAYISFNRLLETDEVFSLFNEHDVEIVWLAVDTGMEETFDEGVIFEPIGFPAYPIWHKDDMQIIDRKVEKGSVRIGGVVSENSVSPDYEIGDSQVLHQQFMKTLTFLADHEKMADRIHQGYPLYLEKRMKYLEERGIYHYGVVITGPTKELLNVREDPTIRTLQVDEVAFWNW